MGNDIKDEMVKGRPKVDRDSNSKVAFDDITIYNFPIDIGDNPACREGCPIRLGDKLIWKSKVDLNSYEDERDTRFTGKQLYIGVSDRASMLLSKGYTLDEIVGVVMEIEKVKKSRAESLKLNSREKLIFAMDSAGRTLRKIVRNGKREEPNSFQARMA